jgi:hypothetical protein
LSSWLRASPSSSRLSSQRASSVLASCHLHRLGCSKFMQSLENAQVPRVDSFCARCVSLNIILRAKNHERRRVRRRRGFGVRVRRPRAETPDGSARTRASCVQPNRALPADGDALE